jgi:hypothetical protein
MVLFLWFVLWAITLAASDLLLTKNKALAPSTMLLIVSAIFVKLVILVMPSVLVLLNVLEQGRASTEQHFFHCRASQDAEPAQRESLVVKVKLAEQALQPCGFGDYVAEPVADSGLHVGPLLWLRGLFNV